LRAVTNDTPQPAIEDLDGMSAARLREVYREVFGEATRSGNRRWLARRIAWRMQAEAEGDLTERARRRAEELARDADLRSRPPTDRGPTLGANLRTVTGKVVRRPDDRVPLPGTVLTREFKGETHRVTVLQSGFEYEGETYRSLTAIADKITGAHWNGFHFFGLDRKRRESA
jgi:hypothetical protein